ncbi:MAG: 7-carboxy-7-deazaguanine synthase QueE [Bdellovibrio bacteriovorus]
MVPSKVRVTEIFHSIQGESLSAGERTAFVRLTGCPLRCTYCDTAYAFKGGAWHGIPTILEQISDYGVRQVCVTGGEPLAQGGCLDLLAALCDAGYGVSLETSGALDVGRVDPRVVKILDLKTPGSGEQQRNLLRNLEYLSARDQVKLVICDEADYHWSASLVLEHGLHERCTVLFSPMTPGCPPGDLADWILRDRLPVRLQIQLHKVLWGEAQGR